MKKFLSILLISCSFLSIAQDQQANLEKYWRYRKRLRNNFILVSQNVETPGVNYPISSIDYNYDPNDVNNRGFLVSVGDNNLTMSHYISILATEYKLLKDNSQDYSETLKELLYALLAVERLDFYTEMQFRYAIDKSIGWSKTDANGFSFRDDLSINFMRDHYTHFSKLISPYKDGMLTKTANENINCSRGNYHFLRSEFENGFENLPNDICRIYKDENCLKCHQKDAQDEKNIPFGYKCISSDNIVHLWEALALVKVLVGDDVDITGIPITWIFNSPLKQYLSDKSIFDFNTNQVNFANWTKDIVRRQMLFMLSNYSTGHIGDIINPITNLRVSQGGDNDYSISNLWYGFAESVNWFFDNNNIDTPFPLRWAFRTELDFSENLLLLTLAEIGNIDPARLSSDNDIYTRLNTVNPNYLKPQMEYIILHGRYECMTDYYTKLEYLEDLLNKAPKYGTRGYNIASLNNKGQMTTLYTVKNILTNETKVVTLAGFLAMTNTGFIEIISTKTPDPTDPSLFSDEWPTSSRLNDPEKLNDEITHEYAYSMPEFPGYDYMLLHNLFYLVYATINPNSHVQLSNEVKFNKTSQSMADKITLKPGFHAHQDEEDNTGVAPNCQNIVVLKHPDVSTRLIFSPYDIKYDLSAYKSRRNEDIDMCPCAKEMIAQCPIIGNNIWFLECYLYAGCSTETDPNFRQHLIESNPCLESAVAQCPCLRLYFMNDEFVDNTCSLNEVKISGDIIDYQFKDYQMCPHSIKSSKMIYEESLENKNEEDSPSFDDDEIIIAPNPCTSHFYINVPEAEYLDIEVLSVTGNLIYKKIGNSNFIVIDMSSQASGLYLIKIKYNNMVKINKIFKI